MNTIISLVENVLQNALDDMPGLVREMSGYTAIVSNLQTIKTIDDLQKSPFRSAENLYKEVEKAATEQPFCLKNRILSSYHNAIVSIIGHEYVEQAIDNIEPLVILDDLDLFRIAMSDKPITNENWVKKELGSITAQSVVKMMSNELSLIFSLFQLPNDEPKKDVTLGDLLKKSPVYKMMSKENREKSVQIADALVNVALWRAHDILRAAVRFNLISTDEGSQKLSTLLDAVKKDSIGKYQSVQLELIRMRGRINPPEVTKQLDGQIKLINELIESYKPTLKKLEEPANKIGCSILKKTYYALAKVLHPDKAPTNKQKEYAESFKKLSAAYEELEKACLK